MHLFASTFLVKKRFRKIRRFFLNLKIKKKDSSEYGQSETAAILNGYAQIRTISGVISARECAPHICMVSASSPASLSM